MYDMLLNSPQMRSAMGWVFEGRLGRVHWFLHQGGIILFGKQMDGDQKLALEMKPPMGTQPFLRCKNCRICACSGLIAEGFFPSSPRRPGTVALSRAGRSEIIFWP
jgi:hypothetical protein